MSDLMETAFYATPCDHEDFIDGHSVLVVKLSDLEAPQAELTALRAMRDEVAGMKCDKPRWAGNDMSGLVRTADCGQCLPCRARAMKQSEPEVKCPHGLQVEHCTQCKRNHMLRAQAR